MEKEQLQEIGQRLRKQRLSLKLTREQMAELADIAVGYYGQLEVGTSQMSVDTLIKLSRSLHLSMDYIICGLPDEPGNPETILTMLKRCDKRELKLAETILKLYLMKN